MADLPFFKYSGTGGGGGISGVSGFNIDENGYLHVTYDDGRIENLGITQDQFDVIDFSNNQIQIIEDFPLLKRLSTNFY